MRMFVIGFEMIADHTEPAVLEGIDIDILLFSGQAHGVRRLGKDNSLLFWCRLYMYLQSVFRAGRKQCWRSG